MLDPASDLFYSVYVAIRTAPKPIKRGLIAKTAMEGDRAADELTQRIMSVLNQYEIKHRGQRAPDASSLGNRKP